MCKYALILGALVVGAMVASGGSLAAILATVIIATGISLSICAIINLSNFGDLPDSISKTRGPDDGWNVDIAENQFKYNVKQYLTYIMPKEEFQERFEKK